MHTLSPHRQAERAVEVLDAVLAKLRAEHVGGTALCSALTDALCDAAVKHLGTDGSQRAVRRVLALLGEEPADSRKA